MKTAFLLTARLKSTRLPEKALRPICGRSVLGHTIDRVRRASRVDEIVVCTSTDAQDDRLADVCAREGVRCFRGEPDDVVKRLRDAARASGADYVTHITGDCPLVDPDYIDRTVEAYERTGADLIRGFALPHGAFSYGIKPAALDRVVEIKADANTEVWGRYFTDTDLFDVVDLDVEPRHRRPEVRLTLDYPEDLAVLEAIFGALYAPGRAFALDDVLRFLDAHPDVAALNRACADRYRRRWSKQGAIALKPRYDVRRAVVIGCGSIGQRHARNLRAMGVDVVALRGRPGHTRTLPADLGVLEVDGWDALAAAKPDVAIVSNPTSLHLETARRLVPIVRGLFIEKPLAATLDGVCALVDEIRARRVVSFVGHVLAFHPAVAAIRARLQDGAIGEPLAFQCRVGQYLPDWHPDEDYRRAYFSRADLGGGVVRSLIHELDLAIALLGSPMQVAASMRRAPELDVDVEAVADLLVRHDGGAASAVHLDYLQRPLERAGAVVGAAGTLSYDLVASAASERSAAHPDGVDLWRDRSFDWNRAFVDEMSTFVRFVREGRVRHDHDASHAAASVALADAAFQSAATGCFAAVAPFGETT